MNSAYSEQHHVCYDRSLLYSNMLNLKGTVKFPPTVHLYFGCKHVPKQLIGEILSFFTRYDSFNQSFSFPLTKWQGYHKIYESRVVMDTPKIQSGIMITFVKTLNFAT